MFRVISQSSTAKNSVNHNIYFSATDEFLAVAAAAGDSAAFNQLLERNESQVRSIVRGVIGCPGEAEDVAKDVCIRAWQEIQTFKPGYKFQSWLSRIAVNLAINAARNGRRAPLLTVVTREDPQSHAVVGTLGSSSARKALALCTAREAKALAMRYLADLSYTEIAEALTITNTSARILVWRGLRQFRKFHEAMPNRS